jgi:translation initiation factor 1A
MWIRDNDLVVLIAPWDFQSDKADIIWRYTAAAHVHRLVYDRHLAAYVFEIHMLSLTF